MSRFTRFWAVRKCEFSDWKRTETRIRPPTTGRIPASPALMRATDERRYSVADPATSSAGTASSALRAASSLSSSDGISGPAGSSTVDTAHPPPPFAAPADFRDVAPLVIRSTAIWRSISAAGRTATIRPR